jgi:hypothetical protein
MSASEIRPFFRASIAESSRGRTFVVVVEDLTSTSNAAAIAAIAGGSERCVAVLLVTSQGIQPSTVSKVDSFFKDSSQNRGSQFRENTRAALPIGAISRAINAPEEPCYAPPR